MPSIESPGFWQIPGREEGGPIAGTLHISEQGDIRLSTLSEFAFSAEKLFSGQGGVVRHPVVQGQVAGPHSGPVTLVDCFVTSNRFGQHGVMEEDYVVRKAYFGANLAADEFQFQRVELRLDGLDAWAGSLTGFRHGDFGSAEKQWNLLSYARNDSIEVKAGGAAILLGMGIRTSESVSERKFVEQATFVAEFPEPRPDSEIWGNFISPLRNLMSFAADRAQDVEEVRLTRTASDDFESNPSILAITDQPPSRDREGANAATRSYDLLFSLAEVGTERLGVFLNRWFEISETYSKALEVHFGLQYGPAPYLDTSFFGAVQSLRLYSDVRAIGSTRAAELERWERVATMLPPAEAEWVRSRVGPRPRPPLGDTIAALADEHAFALDPILGEPRRRSLAPEAEAAAAYYIDREGASLGIEGYWLSSKLQLLFKLCLLRELAFGDEEIRDAISRSRPARQLERRAAKPQV